MSAPTLAGLLERQGFFAGVPERVAATLSEFTSERKAGMDELLFHQGDLADRFYVVKHGLIAVEVYAPGREPIVVDHVDEGEVVGWSWLVAPYRWSFDARAVQPSTLIDIDARAMRERFASDPLLGYEVLKRFVPVMASRLSSARERLVESVSEQL